MFLVHFSSNFSMVFCLFYFLYFTGNIVYVFFYTNYSNEFFDFVKKCYSRDTSLLLRYFQFFTILGIVLPLSILCRLQRPEYFLAGFIVVGILNKWIICYYLLVTVLEGIFLSNVIKEEGWLCKIPTRKSSTTRLYLCAILFGKSRSRNV